MRPACSLVEMEETKVSALIWGHSFVRRVKNFGDTFRGFDSDLGLTDMQITWKGTGGLKFWEVENDTSEIESLQPEIVFLLMFGNDLDFPLVEPEDLARRALAFGRRLTDLGVKKVIFSMVLPRNLPRYSSSEHYNYKAVKFNQTMADNLLHPSSTRRKVRFIDNRYIWLWHRRIMKPNLPDGVHLSKFCGNRQLYYNIKRALSRSARDLRVGTAEAGTQQEASINLGDGHTRYYTRHYGN